MIAIVDYGVGNLFSLCSSFQRIGVGATVTGDPCVIRAADKIVLPGVGAFGDAIRKLRETGLDKVITDEARRGKDLMGICLGMQLLFEKSFEYGEHPGLGLIPGEIRPLAPLVDGLKVPHMGWNTITNLQTPLFKGLPQDPYFYYVHSFYATIGKDTIAQTDYIHPYSAALHKDNFYATQFHPEKSGDVGLAILKNFGEL